MKELIENIASKFDSFRRDAESQWTRATNQPDFAPVEPLSNWSPFLNSSANSRLLLTKQNNPAMRLTPLEQTVIRLDKSLSPKGIEVGRWVVDNARPDIAVRHRNGVTVCFSCGNAMVYAGTERFAKCCECGNIVEIIEENDWLADKRMLVRHFAYLEVVEGLQVIRTFEVVFRYNAINRLKDYSVRELCRHWITSDGRWAVTSLRHFIGGLMPWSRKMKLRKGSTDVEDDLANRAAVIPGMRLLSELSVKLGTANKLMPGNVLSTIRNILEPDYSII